MSPEQVQGLDLDARSDLFSLGVVLWEMLAGRGTFRRDSQVETLHAILKEEAPDLDPALNVPEGLRRILDRCLAKAPEARFHSAHDLVFALESLASGGASVATTPRRPAEGQWWRLGQAMVLAIGLAALGLASGYWWGGHDSRPLPVLHKLTFGKGTVLSAKFTPDGNSVIYTARWQGRLQELFITRTDAPGVTPLGVQGVVVAVRHGEVALIQNGTLSVMPLGGGSPRPVAEGVNAADWDPQGKDFALVRMVPGGMQLEYPAGRVLFRTGGSLFHVSISPQGDRVAFSHARAFGDNTGDIMIAESGRPPRILSPNWRTCAGIAWARGGEEVWFSAGRVWGATSLQGISLDGRVRPILNPGGHLWLFDVSSAGRALVGEGTMTNEIWGRWPGDPSDHEESWLDGSGAFGLSQDGRCLVISEVGPGGGPESSVYLKRTGQGAPVLIGSGRAFDLSRDGAWVLAGLLHFQPRLQLIPTGPGETRILPPGAITRYHNGSFFPDGKRILIVGGGEDQIRRLYVQDLQGGDPRPISEPGCWVPSPSADVSPDGTQVAAIGPDNRPILVPVLGGASRPLPGLQEGDAPIAWSRDGRSLWVVNPAGYVTDARSLFTYDLRTGIRRKVRLLQPLEPAGARMAYFPVLALDGEACFYTVWRGLNGLYLLEGLTRAAR
jgi:Tol biopolymer transport system component